MAPVDRTILTRALVIGLVVAAVGLSACGRKGALEAPTGAAVKTETPADGGTPTKPSKRFILDWLL